MEVSYIPKFMEEGVAMEKQATENKKSPSQLIDERIEELGHYYGMGTLFMQVEYPFSV